MKEFKIYLDTMLQSIGSQFQKREDHIFKGVFLIVAGLLIYEILKWAYQFFDIFRLAILLFVVFVGFVLRKHFGTNTKKSAIVEKLYENKDRIMYLIFIWFFVLLVLSFVLLGENGLRYLIYFCIGMYGLMKFLGFKITGGVDKIAFKSENSLYFLVIGWCFLYIVTSYSLDIYDAGKFSAFIYAGVGVIYFLGYSYFFTNLLDGIFGKVEVIKSDQSSSRSTRRSIVQPSFLARNIYPLMSIFTILGLAGFFYFQSGNENPSNNGTNLLTDNLFEEELQSEIEAAKEEAVEPEFRVAIRKVSELYEFTNRLEVGSEGDEVQKLQGFLSSKGYYGGELDGIFDETTRLGLRDTLIGECGWPETTSGILGDQASVCINNMEVEYKIAINQDGAVGDAEAENISDEFSSTEAFSPDQLLTPEDSVQAVTAALSIGDTGAGVITLQNILIKLGYLASAADGNFDLTTSLALRSVLIDQCGFPEDIDGNYDESAIACIESLTE